MEKNLQRGLAVPIIIGIIVLVLSIIVIGYIVIQNQAGEKDESKMDEMMEENIKMGPMKFSLLSQNNSGQTGTITFSKAETLTKVVIETNGGQKDVMQPTHVHFGTCKNIGAIKFPLQEVVNGKSESLLSIPFDKLWQETPFVVNIHKSASEMEAYVACADITSDHNMVNDEMVESDEITKLPKISEFIIAGTSSPLIDFNKNDYDLALKSNKLIILYFYANWCPICKAEFPIMENVFNELKTENVIGFRVNYNDNQTDNDEKNLAKEFGVAYQHTKVFVKNGERILKSPESWNQDRYISEINKYK